MAGLPSKIYAATRSLMHIKLPDFRKTPCFGMSVCGWTKPDAVKSAKSQGPITYRYGSKSQPRLAYVFSKRGKSRLHLHVDLVEGEPEEDDDVVDRQGLNTFFEQFEGVSLDAGVSAGFMVETGAARDSRFLGSLTFPETEDSKFSMRITGAEIEEKDNPSWRVAFRMADDYLMADIRRPVPLVVGDTYLLEAAESIEKEFARLFLGRPPHDESLPAPPEKLAQRRIKGSLPAGD
jgi:hypothetical protein